MGLVPPVNPSPQAAIMRQAEEYAKKEKAEMKRREEAAKRQRALDAERRRRLGETTQGR
jgi:hypothetical protein